MANALILVHGIIFVGGIVVLLDWWGRRNERRSKNLR